MPRKASPLHALTIRKKIEALTNSPDFSKPVTLTDGSTPCLRLVLYPKLRGGVAGKWEYFKQTKDKTKRFKKGLGPYGERPPGVSLQRARELANEIAEMLAQGLNPMEEERRRKEEEAEAKKAEAAALKLRTPLRKVAELWLEAQDKAGAWADDAKGYSKATGYLKNWILPKLGDYALDDIGRDELFALLMERNLYKKRDTSVKCRSVLSAIGSWAHINGYRKGDSQLGTLRDPILREMLKPYARKVPQPGHNSALPPELMPQFMQDLKTYQGASARALEFMILTACRQDSIVHDQKKILGLRWEHLDLNRGMWHLPRDWTKTKEETDLVLSSYAVDLLKSLPRFPDCSFVFPGKDLHSSIVLGAMGRQIKRMNEARARFGLPQWVDPQKSQAAGSACQVTPHGMRATFMTWATGAAHGNFKRFNRDIVELCLGHKVVDAYGGAYLRPGLSSEVFEHCRELMNAWGRYCATGKWPDEADDE